MPGPGCSKPGSVNPELARILIANLQFFSVRFNVYFVCRTVLSLNNLKLHRKQALRSIFLRLCGIGIAENLSEVACDGFVDSAIVSTD